MKNILKKRLFVTLMLAIVFLPQLYAGEADVVGGSGAGPNVSWSLDTVTGVMTLTGTGVMYDGQQREWNAYSQKIKQLTVSEGITSIGQYAFRDCYYLTSVSLPSTLTDIRDHAFSWCTRLDSIVIPASVENVRGYAFYHCWHMTTARFNGTNATLGSSVFYDCPDLKYVTLPANLQSIPSGCFHQCSGLEYVEIPSTVTAIGLWAFNGCHALDSIHIPSGVTAITEGCFSGCWRLLDVTIPSSVTSIDKEAFSGCRFTAITIPASVTNIAADAFSGCNNLQTYTVEQGNSAYASHDGVVYTADSTQIVLWPQAKEGMHTTPMALTVLPTNCFRDSKITELSFPGVTRVDSAAIVDCSNLKRVHFSDALDSFALGGMIHCYYLRAIDVPQTNLRYTTVDSVLYSKDTTLLIKFPEWKEYADPNYNENEYTLPISAAVKRIGDYSLSYLHANGNIRLSLPEGLDKIDGHAFTGSWMGSLIVDAWNGHVPVVSPETFDFLTYGTKEITVPFMNYKVWAADTVWNKLDMHYRHQDVYSGDMDLIHWTYTTATKELELTGKGPMPTFCDQDYYGWWLLRDSIVSCTIAEGITYIGTYAFVGDTMLTSINFPNSLTGIGYYAFDGCKNLIVPTLPDNIERIEDYAFRGCTHTPVWTQEFPSALQYIGAANFVGLQGPTAIRFPNSLKYIGDSAFAGCPNVEYILFQNAPVEHIGNYAFADCPQSSMSAGGGISLPKTLEYLGDYAFALYNVHINGASKSFPATLPDSLTHIGKAAFLGRNIIWTSTITLPEHLKAIGDSAFAHAKSCNIVRINTRIAPTIGAHTFPAALEKVFVPLGALNSYTSTEHWSQLNCHIGDFTLKNTGVSASTAALYLYSENDADKIDHLEAKNYEFVMYQLSNVEGYVTGLEPETTYDLEIYAVSTAGDRERFSINVTTDAVAIDKAEILRADSFFRFSSYANMSGVTEGFGFEIQAVESDTPFGDTLRIKAKTQDGGGFQLSFYADTILLDYGQKGDIKYRVRPFYYDAKNNRTYYPSETGSEGWRYIQIDDPSPWIPPIFTADTVSVGAREITFKVNFQAFGSEPISGFKVEAINYTTYTTLTFDTIPFEGNNEQIFTVSGFDPETDYEISLYVMSSQREDYIGSQWLLLTTRPAPPVVEYTITFQNWNDSVLLVLQVPENEMPVYTGETPTRPEDDEYTYVFDGWEPQLSIATTDATYVAQYRSIRKEQGIEDIHTESDVPTKILHEGQIYILRGKNIYTVTGSKIK